MAKIIEARAVISAADKTGNTFDKIAAKMKGMEKVAKSFEGIKGPSAFTTKFNDEMARLKLSEKELNSVRKSFGDLDRTLKSSPIGASHYFRSVNDWQNKTIGQWREIKGSVDEAEKAHKRFYKTAGHYGRHAAMHMIGGLGAGYLGVEAVKHLGKKAAERNREGIREEIAGWTPDQQAEANRVADDISKRHPSLSRTENLEDFRKNTARLGSFDRAKEIAEDYAKAKIFNKLIGGDAHELEAVTLTGEGAGAATTTKDLRDFMFGFLKAKAVNSDYSGENFAKDYRAAMAAKYNWNEQYRTNDFFTLASHTPGLGVKLATVNAALVGNRMTKPSRAALQKAGLMDKNGRVVDEKGLQANFFDWTQAHFRPFFEKQGVKFGEHMSEEDKRTVTGQTTKMISSRNAADAIIAALLDASLVYKARKRTPADVDNGADTLAQKDAGTAWTALKTQLGDFGTELMGTSTSISAMNQAARDFAAYTSWIRTGQMPEGLRKGLDWIEGKAGEFNVWPQGIEGKEDPWGVNAQAVPFTDRAFDTNQTPFAKGKFRFSGQDDNETSMMPDGIGYPAFQKAFPAPEVSPSMTYGTGASAPPVVNANVTGEVTGETTIKILYEAGSELIRLVSEVNQAKAALYGALRSPNGPGSVGKSSPDAAAPPSTGGASGAW